jgi:hypothetical protein
MKFLWILLVLLPLTGYASRFDAEGVGEPFTYASLRLNPGYGYLGIQNQDGSRAVFGGPIAAAEFDLVFSFADINLAMGPFIHYSHSFQKNLREEASYSQELNKTDFMYGLKGFISPFFIGFAYGETQLNFSGTGGRDLQLRTAQLGFLGGLRLFKLSREWHISFEGWYKTGFFRKNSNPGLNSNTAAENLELFLNIIWSPVFQIL